MCTHSHKLQIKCVPPHRSTPSINERKPERPKQTQSDSKTNVDPSSSFFCILKRGQEKGTLYPTESYQFNITPHDNTFKHISLPHIPYLSDQNWSSKWVGVWEIIDFWFWDDNPRHHTEGTKTPPILHSKAMIQQLKGMKVVSPHPHLPALTD